MQESTCCFIGHRKIEVTEELRAVVYETVEWLINRYHIGTFLFGSRSEFDALCLEVVTELKEKHPHIRRVYVRAEYPCIREQYKTYLMRTYDDTYYPDAILGAGRAAYVERNRHMIDHSAFCVFYYDEKYTPLSRQIRRRAISQRSGTEEAYAYAKRHGKAVVNVCGASRVKAPDTDALPFIKDS